MVKTLLIISLTILAGWLLTIGLGIISFLLIIAIGWLIKRDPRGESIDDFFAMCGGLAILGLILGALGY